jgi:hypothetical protein
MRSGARRNEIEHRHIIGELPNLLVTCYAEAGIIQLTLPLTASEYPFMVDFCPLARLQFFICTVV